MIFDSYTLTRTKRSGFTLVELLVVVAIIALLVSILLPSLGRAKDAAKSVICATNQRNLAIGWNYYAMDNNDVVLPGRFSSGGTNLYWVGNGLKYRPRWVATMGSLTGAMPFNEPATSKADGGDRQDYTGGVYKCPSVPERVDERNYAFGYNHQFLGNARSHPSGEGYRNFPVNMDSIMAAETVMAADCMGTAAGYPGDQRTPYSNDGKGLTNLSNHAWCLDPPRLTAAADRGTGDRGSPRTAVDPRHMGKVVVSFCDGHVESMTPEEMGYEIAADGKFTDGGHNRKFSGTGDDDDPPAVWD